MLKKSFKQFLKITLVMFFGFAFSTNAFASIIEDNDSIVKAHSIGYWEYHSSIIGKLNSDKNEAYFKFMANEGDRVYVKTWNGLSIEIVDSNNQSIDSATDSDDVEYPTTFPYATVDSDTNFKTFYIKLTRDGATGNLYYSVNVNNRISSSIETFDFSGTASNAGNPDYFSNPDGIDSSVISMDLTNNSTLPNGAIIKSITTSGNLYPSLGGIIHKVSPTSTSIWYDSLAPSASHGAFNIDTSHGLSVAQVWNFKYNFKGTSSSNMSNVQATIDYEYDITKQY